jgi:hypothetical protein
MPLPPLDAGASLAAQLSVLRDALGAVAAPPPVLEGWESLCALEYAGAVHRLDAALRSAGLGLADAAALLAA